jgi:hypothetical protein
MKIMPEHSAAQEEMLSAAAMISGMTSCMNWRIAPLLTLQLSEFSGGRKKGEKR